jgi:lipopolysaccharide biosynthesis glycosyltransferase
MFDRLVEVLRAHKEARLIRKSALFKREWYLDRYPDVKEKKMDPVLHYCRFGWREGRMPGPDFDSVVYLQINSDVADADFNPLYHFERYGRSENRPISIQTLKSGEIGPKVSVRDGLKPDQTEKKSGSDDSAARSSPSFFRNTKVDVPNTSPHCEIINSGFWDENWYLSNYYDEFSEAKKAAGGSLSPLDYYLKQGWRQGHRPSEKFGFYPAYFLSCDPISYFLNHQRFEGYQFNENLWVPEVSKINDYLAQCENRKATKVVYTCITNNYNQLMQPYSIDPEWDYVCFTDCEDLLRSERVGIWKIRKIVVDDLDYSRINRWHKVNPHLLFPEYQESLYLDGNINIISRYIYETVRSTKSPMLFSRHFSRNCAYEEIRALLASRRISEENKNLITIQRDIYEANNFPKNYGLSENNVIYRKHHIDIVKSVMTQWWAWLRDFSSRDQASLAYVLWKNEILFSNITISNIRVSYKDFWIVRHSGELSKVHKLAVNKQLRPAFEGNKSAVVMSCNQNFVSYLGVVLTSIVENASPSETYDIIVLESDIEDATKAFIKEFFDRHDNVSIRFYNMRSMLSQLGDLALHVDGYVPLETYNKIFLSEITRDYKRIAYVDTDIVVNADITELCGVELWGKSIGASRNVANIHAAHIGKEIKGRKFRDYLDTELGIKDYNQYFQAGIVVLDMNSPRVKNLFGLSIEKLRSIRKPVFYDQCIFNSIFYQDVSFFSVGWNHVWYLQSYSYLRHTVSERTFFDYARSRLSPKLVHFASKDKPTNKSGWDLAEYFWCYARKSPFFDRILGEADPLVREEDGIGEDNDLPKRLRPPRILVHLHIHYPDQIEFMLKALNNISGCEVEICVTATENFRQVADAVQSSLPDCRFIKVANVGYDAYPFLKVLQVNNLSKFDYIMKLHTKNKRPDSRSMVYGIDVPGYKWRDDLVNALLGSEEVFLSNLQKLEEDISVGAIGAGRYLFSTLDNNEETNYELAKWRAAFDIDESTHYFGGTMFLARAYPFERFKRNRLEEIDFGDDAPESFAHKNMAHVFERLFGLVIESEGFTLLGVSAAS